MSLLVIDRLSARERALYTAASAACVGVIAAVSLTLRTEAGLLLWSSLYGVITGVYLALSEVLHASLFGTPALGRLLAVNRAFATFSTGLGPVLFAASHDVRPGASYDEAIAIMSATVVAVSLPSLLLSWSTLRTSDAR